ncbi:MAG: GDSL-type esterase/lipase family protein [Planctomycetaceae bacterium]|nr:GDSL-type esterase/lipase family protein [Planctomycetaceae bacterium]
MRFENVELHNVAQLAAATEGGHDLQRVPDGVRAVMNDWGKTFARHGAGCEIRFNVAPGSVAKITLQVTEDNVIPPLASVFMGEFCCKVVHVGREPTTITFDPAKLTIYPEKLHRVAAARAVRFDAGLVRICLPHLHPVRLLSVEGDLTPPRPEQLPHRRYLAYGSSITHGAYAITPECSYAMLTAKALGADLVNMGFGGAARMEPEMAAYIAGRDDWDFATLEMGINVGDWSTQQFHDTIEPFVQTIAAAHPGKWIFCIDLFTFEGDFNPDPPTAVSFRQVVAETVAKINSPKVVHLDGRKLLTDPRNLWMELVHPSADGMFEIARNLSQAMIHRMA